MKCLSRVLAALYELPEKPLDANEFIRDQLSAYSLEEVETLRKQITEHKNLLNQRDDEISSLKFEIESLKAQLEGKYSDVKDQDQGPSFQYSSAEKNEQQQQTE